MKIRFMDMYIEHSKGCGMLCVDDLIDCSIDIDRLPLFRWEISRYCEVPMPVSLRLVAAKKLRELADNLEDIPNLGDMK